MNKAIKEISNCCDVLEKSRTEFKERFIKEYHHYVFNYVNKTYAITEKSLARNEQKKVIIILYDFWKQVKNVVKDSKIYEISISMHKKLMEKYQEEIISKINSCFTLKEEELLDEISI